MTFLPDYDKLHDHQKDLINEINNDAYKEFVMPIIRSGFPKTPIQDIYSKQTIQKKVKWNFKYTGTDKTARNEPESDEFILKGAL